MWGKGTADDNSHQSEKGGPMRQRSNGALAPFIFGQSGIIRRSPMPVQ